MKVIVKTDKIVNAAPHYNYALISCKVKNSTSDKYLWEEIDALCNEFAENNKVEDINKLTNIKATRLAYKALGKDPNRYRPSSEALCRRILKEKSLYRINTLVDLINLVSIKTGYSIGGFDEDKISGSTLTLDAGSADDVFEGIGRGFLNIEGLPVFRDNLGGIGTPTSDNERTKLSMETTSLFLIINGYAGKEGLKESVEYTLELLKKYACAEEIETFIEP